jgi:hypothetical protein
MNMKHELLIREVFRLGDGTTVLACEGTSTFDTLAGREARLLVEGQIRQSIMLGNERRLLNQTTSLNQHALETFDSVDVLPEEVQAGQCWLVLD